MAEWRKADIERRRGDLFSGKFLDGLHDPAGKAIKRVYLQQLIHEADLTDREREALTLRYGFGDSRLTEVGEMMGVTGERVRQLEHRASRRIRDAQRRWDNIEASNARQSIR